MPVIGNCGVGRRPTKAPGAERGFERRSSTISAPRRLCMTAIAGQFIPGASEEPPRTRAGAGGIRLFLARGSGNSPRRRGGGCSPMYLAATNSASPVCGPPASLAFPWLSHPSRIPGSGTMMRPRRPLTIETDAVVAALEADAEVYRGLGVKPQRFYVQPPCSRGIAPPPDNHPGASGADQSARSLPWRAQPAQRGVDLLVEAAELVRRQRSDVTFAFVGPGQPLQAPRANGIVDVGRVVRPRGHAGCGQPISGLPSSAGFGLSSSWKPGALARQF